MSDNGPSTPPLRMTPGELYLEPLTGTYFLPTDHFDGEISGVAIAPENPRFPLNAATLGEGAFEFLLQPTGLNVKEI